MVGNHRFRGSMLALVLVGSPSFAQSQDTAITGARFTLVEKSEDALTVTLDNLRDAPLVAWQIATVRVGSTRPIRILSVDRTNGPYSPDDGAVAPHGRRVEKITADNEPAVTAIMHLAVFADGYYEGPGADAFVQRRKDEADDLRYWIEAVQSIARAPDSDLQRSLKAHLAERGAQMKEPGAGASLIYLVTDGATYSADVVRSALSRRLVEMRRRLASVDSRMVPGRLQRTTDVPSVRITSTASSIGHLYGIVENVRDQPIDALGIVEYERDSNRLRSGHTQDSCGTTSDNRGHGPIQPGERREILLSWSRNPDGSLPNVKLQFVFFDDLKFEGALSMRESVLKKREQRATDAEYWIAALTAAAAQSPEKAGEYLEAKRRERVAQLANTPFGSPAMRQPVDQVIEQIRTAPSEFPALASRIASDLEQQRIQLTKHLAKK